MQDHDPVIGQLAWNIFWDLLNPSWGFQGGTTSCKRRNVYRLTLQIVQRGIGANRYGDSRHSHEKVTDMTACTKARTIVLELLVALTLVFAHYCLEQPLTQTSRREQDTTADLSQCPTCAHICSMRTKCRDELDAARDFGIIVPEPT
jgi:hypothetical protein